MTDAGFVKNIYVFVYALAPDPSELNHCVSRGICMSVTMAKSNK